MGLDTWDYTTGSPGVQWEAKEGQYDMVCGAEPPKMWQVKESPQIPSIPAKWLKCKTPSCSLHIPDMAAHR